VPLGPGYQIQKQQMQVRFEASPTPVIHVEAEYQLKNSGNQPLPSLELRLPGRRFRIANLETSWDGVRIDTVASPGEPHSSLLQFPQSWSMASRHTLRLAFEIRQPPAGENGLGFTTGAFFLPQGGWSPELFPPQGLFGFGGVPPKRWNLLVTVPQDFRVHASGKRKKRARHQAQASFRFEQTARDLYPFVVAGRYADSPLNHGKRTISFWTHSAPHAGRLASAADLLERELNAYDQAFGARGAQPMPLWIVECPSPQGCITGRNASFAKFFGEESGAANAEMISLDTVVVDFSGDVSRIAAIAGPSLAASWLGYGRNPGFYEQEPPLSALPLFAAALGREAAEGPDARLEMIRSALAEIPLTGGSSQDPRILRAKSFLFFYGLRDRYGPDVFRRSIQHMLHARRGRGFDLDDLIAAFEQETHQNVAEFVRLWMKHPGVPEDFRLRYSGSAAAATPRSEEKHP
jgi:hypothetical protein